MQRAYVLVGIAFLIGMPGMAETVMTAQDYAVDSDVVLESVVKEVKAMPRDTVDVIGDGIKYFADETITAAKGVAAVFQKDVQGQTKKDANLAIANAWDSSNDIVLRTYKVRDEMAELLLASGDSETAPSIDVSGFFTDIKFSKKQSAYFMPTLNRLIVRQTLPNILKIESLLADYSGAQRDLLGRQVEVEAKIIEVNQTTLDELGFDWQVDSFGSKNNGNLTVMDDLVIHGGSVNDFLAGGLRSASAAINSGVNAGSILIGDYTGGLRWDVVINALERADDSDVLSAPRVTVRDGETATIQVGEDRMMPQEFDVNNGDASPWIEHSSWEPTLIGVYMEVTPEIREEGLIDLELNPRILDYVGDDTYQVVVENALSPELWAMLPYLRVREFSSRVTVADGSTVGMGGLIYEKLETFRDKVPVLGSIPYLGRLFRSEGERNVKRNLMIFVTATQVDVDGRRAADVAFSH